MRIMEIHNADNGFVIMQEEGRLSIANSLPELKELIEVLCVEHATEKEYEIPGEASAPSKVIPFKPATATPSASPAAELIGDAEYQRIVAENDRKGCHARLDIHVANGVITEYNNRMGIKNLVQLLIGADKVTATAGQSEAPPPAAPPVDPFAVAPVVALNDVATSLQAAAQACQAADPKSGAAEVVALLTARGVSKVSELPENEWEGVVAEANALTTAKAGA